MAGNTGTNQVDFEQAVALHQAGDLAAAEALYRRVLEVRPDHWDAMYLLGTVQLQLGRFADCAELLAKVVAARPERPDAHNNLGVALKALGRWEDAARAFQAAIKAKPDYEQAFFNLGTLMEERGLWADAEKCYRHALDLNPSDTQCRLALGNVLKSQQRWQDAEDCYRDVIGRTGEPLDVKVNLAYVLARQERLDEAADVYRQILEVRPDYYQVHNSLSYVYERQGQLDAAADTARRAIDIRPDFAEGHNNLGTALLAMHRLEDACDCFRSALELKSDFALSEFNFGTTKLLAGDYAAGWQGYARHSALNGSSPRRFTEPRWDGGPIDGRTLLVYADQGFGDAIQFARFLKPVRERFGARIVFECPLELKELFSSLDGADPIVAEGEKLPRFDTQVPLANLPGLLGVTLETLAAKAPYVAPPSHIRDEFLALLSEVPRGRPKIGLVWQGNPQQARDVMRSCPFEKLLPLVWLPGFAWFSLQTERRGIEQLQRSSAAGDVIDVGSRLRNFADTAAVIERLDLVITVDTAAAHLAGALGCDVWTLLCHTPDWRWHLERRDSPWYPTMRLYRQPKWGDWAAVIEEVAGDLGSRS